jgi:hypothetical protein
VSGLILSVFGCVFVLRGLGVERELFLLGFLLLLLFVDLTVPVKIVDLLYQFD